MIFITIDIPMKSILYDTLKQYYMKKLADKNKSIL